MKTFRTALYRVVHCFFGEVFRACWVERRHIFVLDVLHIYHNSLLVVVEEEDSRMGDFITVRRTHVGNQMSTKLRRQPREVSTNT